MARILRHLKPFTISIIFIFVLLFGQAMAELALPGYMANIINVGIQQGGIENAVPDVIRTSGYDKLILFMTEDEQALVSDNYRLLERHNLSAEEYEAYVEEYPALAEEALYVLNTDDGEVIDALDPVFAQAIGVVVILSGDASSLLPESSIELPELPEGVDVFEAVAAMTPEQREASLADIEEMTASIPRDFVTQFAIEYLKGEYEAIGIDINDIQFGYLFRIGGLMIIITIGGSAAAIYVGYLASRVAAGLGRNLRLKLFERVESFSNVEFDKFSTATLITRSTNDIQQIQMLLVMLFRILFFAPIVGIGGIIRMVSGDASMAWIIGIAVTAMVIMFVTLFSVAIPKFKIIQKLVDKVNLAMREILTGLLVIRAFNTQKHEEKKFDDANVDLTRINLFIQRVMVLMQPVMMLIMNGSMLLIIWIGGHQIANGTTQVGDLAAFMQYIMLIIMSFMMISMIFFMMPRAIVSLQRINQVLDTEPVIRDPRKSRPFDDGKKGYVEFKDVTFRYPGAEEAMLKGISFIARPGETTAVIGSTGSGKSTLINLIPRFYDVTEGSVVVDGVDVREVNQHDLRDKIGYVPQKASLFSGTIGTNLRYADENAEEPALMKAVASAQASDFIVQAEGGLDAPVSQHAANLSGGQKQRLSIARALVKQPEIYIFDDSFSALDFKTDSAVRRALRRDTREATVIIVTQRISTVMGAEQIIVLEHGKIVGVGRHRDLLKTCDVYREIAQSQLSEEELNS